MANLPKANRHKPPRQALIAATLMSGVSCPQSRQIQAAGTLLVHACRFVSNRPAC
jgi:hypothetical protein